MPIRQVGAQMAAQQRQRRSAGNLPTTALTQYRRSAYNSLIRRHHVPQHSAGCVVPTVIVGALLRPASRSTLAVVPSAISFIARRRVRQKHGLGGIEMESRGDSQNAESHHRSHRRLKFRWQRKKDYLRTLTASSCHRQQGAGSSGIKQAKTRDGG